ncbi:hypothetical protein [Roseateles sp.]|uniref:hypothetical protein n=1 Tax=Roseateles sp. TaxID=1971397 RepID=UPI00286A728E|nr:hypothetical protein [Roseateles sp.]
MPTYTSYAGEIASQLGAMRTKGHHEAAANRPASDSLRMDQHESALQNDAEKWLASEQLFFDTALTEASKAVADIQQKTIALQMNVEQLLSDSSLQSTIEADLAGERQKLMLAAGDRMRAEVDWRHFRAINNIQQQADYPESRYFHFGLIFVLALIETFINAFFYENSAGLLGGIAVALGVALINLGGALGLGIGWRYKNLLAADKRIVGWMCFCIFIVFAIYCNALFASFRSEFQILLDPSDVIQMRQAFLLATGEAKKIFIADMHFADLTSFILFGLGLILSCFAFYKGYTADDKHPGYGKKDRLVKKLQQIELEKQEILRQQIKDFLQRRRAEIQSTANEPSQLNGRAALRISDLQGAVATACTQGGAIQRDFSNALMAYREANTAVRATDPPPHFKIIPDLTSRISCSAAEAVVLGLGQAREDANALRDKYQVALRDRMQAFQLDSAAIMNQTFGLFLRNVEDEAKEKIDRLTPTIHRAA